MATIKRGIRWVEEMMAAKRISIARAAERGKFSQSSFTHLKNGTKTVVGFDLVKKFAIGLEASQTIALKRFGLIDDEEVTPEEWSSQLTKGLKEIEDDDEREETVELVEAIIQKRVHTSKARKAVAPSDTNRLRRARGRT